MLSDRFPGRRLAIAINIFLAGAATGVGVSWFLGALIFTHATELGRPMLPFIGAVSPWQYVFIVLGLPGVLIAPLIFLVPEPLRRSQDAGYRVDRTTFRAFLYRRRTYLLFVFGALSLIGMITYGTGAWLVTYLLRAYGISVREAGAISGGMIMVAGICGFPLTGWLADRLYANGAGDAHFKPLLLALPLLMVLAIAGFGLLHNLWMAVGCYGLIFFIFPTAQCLVSHVQLTTPPELR